MAFTKNIDFTVATCTQLIRFVGIITAQRGFTEVIRGFLPKPSTTGLPSNMGEHGLQLPNIRRKNHHLTACNARGLEGKASN